MDYEQILQGINDNFNLISHSFLEESEPKSKLIQNCEKLRDDVENIFTYADEYNYKNIRANGFFTFISFIDKFFQIVLKFTRAKKHENDLVNLSESYISLAQEFDRIRAETSRAKQAKEQEKKGIELVNTFCLSDPVNIVESAINLFDDEYSEVHTPKKQNYSIIHAHPP